jgi:hypothetical protein
VVCHKIEAVDYTVGNLGAMCSVLDDVGLNHMPSTTHTVMLVTLRNSKEKYVVDLTCRQMGSNEPVMPLVRFLRERNAVEKMRYPRLADNTKTRILPDWHLKPRYVLARQLSNRCRTQLAKVNLSTMKDFFEPKALAFDAIIQEMNKYIQQAVYESVEHVGRFNKHRCYVQVRPGCEGVIACAEGGRQEQYLARVWFTQRELNDCLVNGRPDKQRMMAKWLEKYHLRALEFNEPLYLKVGPELGAFTDSYGEEHEVPIWNIQFG